MPVPAQLSDLKADPATNSPQGTESARGVVDDYLRAHGAFIRQLSDELKGTTVVLPSAATVNIGFAKSANIAITGTTAISAFDVYAEGTLRWVQFRGAMTLTHNAAVIALPGSADILTTSGDNAVFKSAGGGKWECLVYQYKAGYLTAKGGTIDGGLTVTQSVAVGGDVSVAGQLRAKDGTAASPGLTFISDTNTGFVRESEGVIAIVCNGAIIGRFKPTGIEGINMTLTP